MQNVLLFTCLLLLIGFAVCTIVWRCLLKSTLALTVSGIMLAIILFFLGLPMAALFQLLISAGLVTIILIGSISLTDSKQTAQDELPKQRRRLAWLPPTLILGGTAIVLVVLFSNLQLTLNLGVMSGFDQFSNLFWQTRQVDILGQIIIVLAGAFVVTVFFKHQTATASKVQQTNQEENLPD